MVRAAAHANGRVSITYTVRGVSSMYDVWGHPGPPTDAGPRRTRVYVDGREAGGSDGGAIACRAGNPLQHYVDRWPWSRLSVRLAPGTHEVVVRAPYCVDGRLVPSVDRVLVVTH